MEDAVEYAFECKPLPNIVHNIRRAAAVDSRCVDNCNTAIGQLWDYDKYRRFMHTTDKRRGGAVITAMVGALHVGNVAFKIQVTDGVKELEILHLIVDPMHRNLGVATSLCKLITTTPTRKPVGRTLIRVPERCMSLLLFLRDKAGFKAEKLEAGLFSRGSLFQEDGILMVYAG